ncbi:MAG: 4-hydroxy-3-methylbut-2-enyl diphosphate reductase [Burkholderiaceae bacterium]|nr:4-hydroxy-3-methylbut-2-enyl diphosphate reductase [Burkholderiaceae bacterium]
MDADARFDVLLAQPRGFCAGVTRAIEIVERALALHGAPVYVFHEIVHNGHVVADLRARGAVFVDSLDDVPPGAMTVFSAHGVSRAVVRQAQRRALDVIDATCPLVTKVHLQAQRYARLGFSIIVIGHRGHEEVEGTMGSVDAPVHLVSTVADVQALPLAADAPLAYVTQTTLSLDDTREVIAALTARFPAIVGPHVDDICYATQNRQNAVRAMAAQVDLVIVVGARNSSNSARLREVAAGSGSAAHLVQDAADIDPAWLADVRAVGLTAGASTPEVLVRQVADRLRALGAGQVRPLDGVRETVVFRLPAELLRRTAAA